MELVNCEYKGLKEIDGEEYHAFESSVEFLVIERPEGAELAAFLNEGDKIMIKGKPSELGNQVVLKNVEWDFSDE